MSAEAMEGLRANLTQFEEVLDSLSDDEWRAPSACEGWRIQEVVAHLASSFRAVAGEPAAAPAEGEDPGAEELAEMMIVEQRSWTPAQVYAEYEVFREPFLGGLDAMQEEPLASTMSPLADLGTHPLHILADAFVFDAYCHLRHDVLAPAGPIERSVPTPTAVQVRPGLDWMLAGLPQMCADEMRAAVTAPIQLELTGPGGGTWTVAPAGEAEFVQVSEGAHPDLAATVTSTAHDFISWATKRSDWRDSCTVTGDEALAAQVLDVVNVV